MVKPIDDPDRAGSLSALGEPGLGLEGAGRAAFDAFYRQHFRVVDRAVGQVLTGADKETVVHEVFLRLLTSETLRLGFRGGSVAAWLTTVARNQAIDYHRRRRFELPAEPQDDVADVSQTTDRVESRAEAKILVDKFRRERLPAKWASVFDLRFLGQLEQKQAAKKLGISRTTLAYQEYRIRALLRRFVLSLERAPSASEGLNQARAKGEGLD